jgi:hypothetical protein
MSKFHAQSQLPSAHISHFTFENAVTYPVLPQNNIYDMNVGVSSVNPACCIDMSVKEWYSIFSMGEHEDK